MAAPTAAPQPTPTTAPIAPAPDQGGFPTWAIVVIIIAALAIVAAAATYTLRRRTT